MSELGNNNDIDNLELRKSLLKTAKQIIKDEEKKIKEMELKEKGESNV